MPSPLLLTHDDMDGAGCAMMVRSVYPDADVEHHDYNTIDARFKELTKKLPTNYDEIIVADIAAKLGGGGHEHASGFTPNTDLVQLVAENILTK